MTMQTRLQDDLKQAMRDRDVLRRSVIRYVRSEIHNQEIAKKTELDDEGILRVLIRQAQQRRESIQAYGDANREDLVEKEQAELEIILEYLPQQLTREEITELVNKVVQEVGAKGLADKGKVMGKLMPQVRGKADGTVVNQMATEYLESLA
ncbi:MAG: GatB/YqeY domain-containing protein [Chloroflexi bacterium]|nr:GatB/YqeY domain-containing protein [Chloroflexota bacterium]